VTTLFTILFDKPYAFYSSDFTENDNAQTQISYYANAPSYTVITMAVTMQAHWGQFPSVPDMSKVRHPVYEDDVTLHDWRVMLYSLNSTMCAGFNGPDAESTGRLCEFRYSVMNESEYKTVSMGMLQHPGFALLGAF
jgi:hypothetical protein